MKQLAFRAVYISPILAGTKTTTLRTPRSGLPAQDDEVAFRCQWHKPPFAYAYVTGADEVAVRNLTDRHARADGFPDARALRAAIRSDYPDANRMVIIRFRVISQ